MPATSSLPLLLPPSETIVNVRVIDSTARVHVPMASFVETPLPGHETLHCPAFVFLIEHPGGKKLLFDLGVREDQFYPPVVAGAMKGRFTMDVEKNVVDILTDENIRPSSINSIIWSHWHLDHSGDPATFPGTTELVVGPGFKKAFLPGYPENPMAVIHTSDYVGRDLREIEFSDDLKIGELRAFDFFNDGSFYLLDCPGHTIGHICALARTTPTTFIFMGADACHHCGALRPNEYTPLPDELSPSPFSQPPHLDGTICPGALLETIHPQQSRSKPFYGKLSSAPGRDVAEAEAVIEKMKVFDASPNVFVIIAHDSSLLDVIDLFPASSNSWKEEGWKEMSRWRFLQDFSTAVKSVQEEVVAW